MYNRHLAVIIFKSILTIHTIDCPAGEIQCAVWQFKDWLRLCLTVIMYLIWHFGRQYLRYILPVVYWTGVAAGVNDIEPRDQQAMTPAELNARNCGQVTTSVGKSETVTLTCPPGGVTGRYLIVQLLGRNDYLVLCEVEAGRALVFLLCYRLLLNFLFFIANGEKNMYKLINDKN